MYGLMNSFYEKLGKLLLRLRTSRGLSYNEMGNLLFVSGRTVRRWENAEATPTVNDIINICSKFDITLEAFFAAIENQNSNFEQTIPTAKNKSVYYANSGNDTVKQKKYTIIDKRIWKWILVVLILLVTVFGIAVHYHITHNYIISSEGYNVERLGCYPAMDGLEIAVRSDGKNIIIAIFNRSNEGIDFSSSSTINPELYMLINDDWHYVYKKENAVIYMSPPVFLEKGEAEIITADCTKSYGGFLPSGTYRIVFRFEGTDSGKYTYAVEFKVLD